MNEISKECLKKISELKPEFQPIVIKVMKGLIALGHEPKVYEGLRTKAQQAEKVRLGYSKTMKSYHLSGYAVDIADRRYAWNVSRLHPFWYDYAKIIFEVAKSHPGLGWGGIWSKGKLDTAQETDRWRKYEAAVKSSKDNLSWFCDVAHLEMRV
jgi:hypothetical protein